MIKSKGVNLIGQWKTHTATLNSAIKNHKAVIAEQDERLQELEAVLREHGLLTAPAR
jgi:hypothetical protein